MTQTRLVMPLLAAVLVLAALGLVLWPASRPPAEPAPGDVAAVAPAVEAAVSSLAAPKRVVPVRPAAGPVGAPAARADDGTPATDVPDDPPEVNDALAPEKPQTAEWKLGKTEHLRALLARHVTRLEQERAEALAKGDRERADALSVRLERERRRQDVLQQDAARLAEEARHEAQ